jgi:hypothetical protein
MRMSRRRVGVFVLGPLLLVAACGGTDDGSSDESDAADSGGEIALGESIPDYFPSDFYLPDGMTVAGVSRAGDAVSLTGTFETGEIDAIQADMVAGLQAAGYELLSDDETAVFVKSGVGRVRVRTSDFLGERTVSVDIDTWTDEQLDELRGLFAEEVVVSGRAIALVGDQTYEAEGDCRLHGLIRSFGAGDVSITLQIDESQEPTVVYADVTAPDGTVFMTEYGADIPFSSSDEELFAKGDMVEFNNEAAGSSSFSMTVTCDS